VDAEVPEVEALKEVADEGDLVLLLDSMRRRFTGGRIVVV